MTTLHQTNGEEGVDGVENRTERRFPHRPQPRSFLGRRGRTDQRQERPDEHRPDLRDPQLWRSTDPLSAFEPGPNPFRGGAHANRVRHVALVQRGGQIYVFFTAIGDAPERILMSTIPLSGDWSMWLASTPIEVLQPEAPYECATLPNAPSVAGDIKAPARQLRDPAIFEENGRTFLFYSFCGEQGIAAAELTFQR